ncbi:TPA: hypothetical protein HA318_02685 [Candidatus Micrarchaeota archaeon]|nr:MAG: hypothetical protein AUJ65_05535 [Candidatus Micrarchaeota archaeon CG1_02_51_15]HII38884.1 hypothetical protein [Candidatus Micrarchaeota archaeon]
MEVRKDIYLKAALVAIALFAISLSVGYYVEAQNYSALENKLSDIEDSTQTAMLVNLFMQTHDSTSMCPALESELNDVEAETYAVYSQLEQNKGANILTNYDALRKKYFLMNVRFYLMLRAYKQSCANTALKPILFFYDSQNDCPSCVAQGKVLDSLRQKCENYKVYAFPNDVPDIRMIKAFKTNYHITTAPSLVINDETLNGLQSEQQILSKAACQARIA